MRSRFAVAVMLALVFFGLAAPGVRADAAGARKKLEKEDVPFTPEKFFSSVSRGDVKTVSLFLEAGMPVDTRDKNGGTALLGATHHADPKLLLLLLKAGADVNAKFSQGRTALHEAVTRDRPAVVAALLQAGADVNARDSSGRTPLFLAASFGRAQVIPLLLQAGADPQITDRTGESPLAIAERAREPEAVKLLQDAKAVTPPPLAAGPDVPAAVDLQPASPDAAQKELARRGFTLSKKAFFERVNAGDVRAVQLMLAAGMETKTRNATGRPPLYLAVEAGDPAMVKMLLAAGANPNDAGAAVDERFESGETLIMKAADGTDVAVMKALIAAGADVNKGNDWKVNGLMSAARQGKREMVETFAAKKFLDEPEAALSPSRLCYFPDTTAPPASFQPFNPPRRHTTFLNPLAWRSSTARALVCSEGHVQ